MKPVAYPITSFIIILVELILCFLDPMALMTTPIYNVGGTNEDAEYIFKR